MMFTTYQLEHLGTSNDNDNKWVINSRDVAVERCFGVQNLFDTRIACRKLGFITTFETTLLTSQIQRSNLGDGAEISSDWVPMLFA